MEGQCEKIIFHSIIYYACKYCACGPKFAGYEKGMVINMNIGGMSFLQEDYRRAAVTVPAAGKSVLNNTDDYEFLQIKESRLEKGRTESDALPKKGEGAPYSYLADANGIIDYKGVIFVCDNEKRELCLGDVQSNPDDVIRIPLSGGGCLKVNRNNIDDLSKAIGMFSPEDINLILRALKMDAKIQQMKREIEEMEDGVGKSSGEQNADSVKAAKEAEENTTKAGGFNGYEESEKEGVFGLLEWQLDLLTEEAK